MTELVIFTVRFPYHKHEVFLEAEIVELAKQVDKITIQPMQGTGPMRHLPDNVVVAPPLWSGKAEKLKFYARGLLNWKVWRLAIEKVAKAGGKSPAPKSMSDLSRLMMWSIYRVALESSEVVRRLLSRGEDDGKVVAYSYWGHTPALALPLLAKQGIPTAVRFHRVDLYREALAFSDGSKSRLQYFPWHQELADTVSLLVFISKQGRDYFLENWGSGGQQEKAIVSYLGTSKGHIEPSEPTPKAVELLVASCSRLEAVKQVDRIYALVVALSEQYKVGWVHFGGSEEDLERAKAEFAPIDGRLTVEFRGHVPNSEIAGFYDSNEVDLFVNLSASEGVPVSIMEAISFGIPVLATDVGGVSDVVAPGRSGVLCSLADSEDAGLLASKVTAGLQEGGEFKQCDPKSFWDNRFRAQENYRRLAEQLRIL